MLIASAGVMLIRLQLNFRDLFATFTHCSRDSGDRCFVVVTVGTAWGVVWFVLDCEVGTVQVRVISVTDASRIFPMKKCMQRGWFISGQVKTVPFITNKICYLCRLGYYISTVFTRLISFFLNMCVLNA
jgi:hypothetical protein